MFRIDILKAIIINIVFCCTFSNVVKSQDINIKLQTINIENGLSHNIVTQIIKDKYGFIWAGTYDGINRYDGYKFLVFKHSLTQGGLSDSRVSALLLDKAGNLWVKTQDNVLSRFDYETETFSQPATSPFKKKFIDSIIAHQNRDTTLSFANRSITIGNTVIHYIPAYGDKIYIANDVLNYYKDNDNLLWQGTQNGLRFLNLNPKKFFVYRKKDKNDNTLVDNNIRVINEDASGNLLIGANAGGVTIFNRNTNTSTNLIPPLIKDNYVRFLYCDKEGYIWIGQRGELEKYDPKTKKVKLFTDLLPNDKWIYSIAEDNKGYLWFGTFGGLLRLDKKQEKFTEFNSKNGMLLGRCVRMIMKDSENNLWVSVEDGGVTKLSPSIDSKTQKDTMLATFYAYDKNNKNSISAARIIGSSEDIYGDIWFATANGVCKFDKKKKQFNSFGQADGLPEMLIDGILADNIGNVWFTCNQGLFCYTIKTKNVRKYQERDGFPSKEFSNGTAFKSKSGELFFGTPNGFIAFFPQNIVNKTTFAPVYFTDLSINSQTIKAQQPFNNRIVLTKPIYLSKEITLTHNDYIFSIEFAALDYANPMKIQYKTMLEGFDKEWNDIDANNRKVTFTNLDPGTYILKIQATNSDGIWNPTLTELKIIVLPPWWATWWFRTIVILTIIVSAFQYYRFKVNQLTRQKKILENKVKERTKELELANFELKEKHEEILQQNEEISQQAEELQTQAEQLEQKNIRLVELDKFKETITGTIVHDLKNPLNSIIVLSELMLPFEDDADNAMNLRMMNQSGKQMLQLVMNILDVQKFESAKMKLEKEELELLEIIQNTMMQVPLLLEQKQIKTHINISKELKIIGDANLLLRAFTNIFTNAIKFTPVGGSLFIDAQKSENTAKTTISIRDTGCGIKAERLPTIFEKFSQAEARDLGQTKSTGLGLNFCKMTVEAHGGRIWVESEVGVGTTFFIEL